MSIFSTLFKYIFWDLIRKFALAAGALAGIMSFGGILRPLTRQGLGLLEVVGVLMSLMPAMMTYAFPIAALFATTLVYGRLSADNEILAMRAGGISHAAAALPAFFLGIIVAIGSVCMLCFVVPTATRNVEHIIYSNVGRVLATDIERTHEFSLGAKAPTLSAQGAVLLPPDPREPGVQTVILDSPLIISSKVVEQPDKTRLSIPKEFLSARLAFIKIRPMKETEQVEMRILLEDGVGFPRQPEGANIAGVSRAEFRPDPVNSLISEKTKFMDLGRLHQLRVDPESDRRVREAVAEVNRTLQQVYIYESLKAELDRTGSCTFQEPSGERHTFHLQPGWSMKTGKDFAFDFTPAPGTKVRYETLRGAGAPALTVEATKFTILVSPNVGTEQIDFELTFDNASVKSGPNERPQERNSFRRTFTMPAPAEVTQLSRRSAQAHLSDATLPPLLLNRLHRALIQSSNEVWGELNARMSFAVSCFVLVLMGVALGMMFKSGNYLTAFAVSVGPALACILLTVTGQHTLENVPRTITEAWVNPLPVGITMIWAGNFVVFISAMVLLFRLQKK